MTVLISHLILLFIIVIQSVCIIIMYKKNDEINNNLRNSVDYWKVKFFNLRKLLD